MVRLWLPEETVRRIDASRGLVTRSAFVRWHLNQVVGSDGQGELPVGLAPVLTPEPARRPKLRAGGGGRR